MSGRVYDELVLAVRPTPRGFAYALFEAPLSPVDWGQVERLGNDQATRTVEAVARLLKKYRPDTLVLEARNLEAARFEKARHLHTLLSALVQEHDVDLVRYSRPAIRGAFHYGMITRYEIAQAIAAFIPAFESRLPTPRKLWDNEDRRMWLFDAASLAMTHFAAIAGAEPP
jgi:hypothetical protein